MAKGVSVIVATSELPELLMLTDRILVLAEGKLSKELISSQTDQVEIMRYAVPRSGKIGSRNLSVRSQRFEDQGTNRSTTKSWERGNRWSSIGRFALENDAFVVLLCFFIGASVFRPRFLDLAQSRKSAFAICYAGHPVDQSIPRRRCRRI